MKSPYTKKFFEHNRTRLREIIADEIPIILTANTLVQRCADTSFPFRQDTNFWYVTGLDFPDAVYVHDGQKESLILPKSNTILDIFNGVTSKEEVQNISGIERILTYEQGAKLLRQITLSRPHIGTLLPATALQTRYNIAPNPARKQLVNRLRRLKVGITFKHLGVQFSQLRSVKTSEEIKAIETSVNLTVEAFKHVKTLIKSQVYEYEIEAEFSYFFKKQNARHAYGPIVASGKNATILHYEDNDQKLPTNSQILIDIGAEAYRGAADISRTYATGKPSKRLKDVHAGVLHMQDFACDLLRPELDFRDYEMAVEKEMGVVLKQLGIINTATRKQIRKYYPHATSHHLGLDVHDSVDYSLPLKENMILTVEPGIYLPNENIGVRIEDNVLVSNDGIINLSKTLPRDLW